MAEITKEQIIQKLDSSFVSIALEDLKRARDQNTNLAVFILGSCLIEAFGGFLCGQKEHDEKGAGNRYREFVKKYMTNYDPNDLWKSLRNGLIHSYAEKGKYTFVNKKRDLHLHLHEDGKRTVLNDENFVEELEIAYDNYKKDLLQDDDIFEKAKVRFEKINLMQIRQFNILD